MTELSTFALLTMCLVPVMSFFAGAIIFSAISHCNYSSLR
jgi:nitrate reductase NapE component